MPTSSVIPIRDQGLPDWLESLGRRIIGCAIEVHRHLGPGLLESLYEEAMASELTQAGLQVERQIPIRVPYKSITLHGQRLDLVVADLVVLELKSVAEIQDVHKAQVNSYLWAGDYPLGYLLNLNVAVLKTGVRRLINSKSSRVDRTAPRLNDSDSSRSLPSSLTSRSISETTP